MEELNEEVTEEVTEQDNEQSLEQEVENVIDETKFESAGNDSVIKVDLSQPPPVGEEVVEEKENTEPEIKEEVVEKEQPIMEEVTEQEPQTVEEAEEIIEEAAEEGADRIACSFLDVVEKAEDYHGNTFADAAEDKHFFR